MKRNGVVMGLTMILSSILSFPTFANWEQQSDSTWKYKDDISQQYVASQWIESTSEKGLWYYINADGIMATNTLIDNQYYVNEAGEWRESGEPTGKKTTSTGGTVINDLSGGTGGYTVPEKEIYVP